MKMPIALENEESTVRTGCDGACNWDFGEVWNECVAKARRQGLDSHDAEDIASSVYLDLAREARKSGLESVRNRHAYVSTLVRNEVVNHRRRNRKRENDIGIGDAADLQCPSQRVQEAKQEVRDLLLDLDEDDRRLLEMKYVAGCTWQEVGEHFGVTGSGACQRFVKLAAKLRRLRAFFDLDQDDVS